MYSKDTGNQYILVLCFKFCVFFPEILNENMFKVVKNHYYRCVSCFIKLNYNVKFTFLNSSNTFINNNRKRFAQISQLFELIY